MLVGEGGAGQLVGSAWRALEKCRERVQYLARHMQQLGKHQMTANFQDVKQQRRGVICLDAEQL